MACSLLVKFAADGQDRRSFGCTFEFQRNYSLGDLVSTSPGFSLEYHLHDCNPRQVEPERWMPHERARSEASNSGPGGSSCENSHTNPWEILTERRVDRLEILHQES